MKFKTIIFDLDGTIADTLPLCIAAFKSSIEPLLGEPLGEAEIIANFGPSEEGTIRKLVPGQEEEGIRAYLQHYEDLHHTCPVAFAGITDLLDFLNKKGIKLAMVTGKGAHSTKISLQKFDLEDYFGILETGSPDGPNKINGILNVMTRLNARPDETLYIGDAPSDVVYCKEAGVPIAAVAWAKTTNPKALAAQRPDWLFYSVQEFKGWVKERI